MTDTAPYPDLDGTQACAELDPEAFFPTDRVDSLLYGVAAIRACRRCPFIRPCLAYAITHGVHGIWGGTTEEERASIRRKHKISADNTGLTRSAGPVPGDEVVRLYRAGFTTAAIAIRFDTTTQTVNDRLRQAGEPRDD